jgi:hypothetical protein
MAATSKHPGDIFNWVLKVIESCETVHQLQAARNLVYCFDKMNVSSIAQVKEPHDNFFYWHCIKKIDDKFFEFVEKKLFIDK